MGMGKTPSTLGLFQALFSFRIVMRLGQFLGLFLGGNPFGFMVCGAPLPEMLVPSRQCLGLSVSYWGCLSLRNFDARGPSQEGASRPGRRLAGHSGVGLYYHGLPDRTGCPVWVQPGVSGI